VTPDEVRLLYAKIIGYDNRKPSEANLHAWAEQADLGRWTLAEALAAVAEHHRTSTDYLMPAHLHALIRSARQHPQPIQQLRQLDAPAPADEHTRARIMAMIGETFALPRRVRRAGRQPEPRSADEADRLAQARAELDAIRHRAAPPSERGDAESPTPQGDGT
jgi:hypothetical protein